MLLQVKVRIVCTGANCPGHTIVTGTDADNQPATFEGWVDAEYVGDSNYIRLKGSPLPKGWATRSMEGSGEQEPLCQACGLKWSSRL